MFLCASHCLDDCLTFSITSFSYSVSYIVIVAINHHDQKQVTEVITFFVLWFQMQKSCGKRDITAESKRRKLRDQFSTHRKLRTGSW